MSGLHHLCLLLLGATTRACAPNMHTKIMHGLDLGLPVTSEAKATSWKECCDLCLKDSNCIAWTYSQESMCVVRNEIGTRFRIADSKTISGIMKSSVPVPQGVTYFVGILSGPRNRAKVIFIAVKVCMRTTWMLFLVFAARWDSFKVYSEIPALVPAEWTGKHLKCEKSFLIRIGSIDFMWLTKHANMYCYKCITLCVFHVSRNTSLSSGDRILNYLVSSCEGISTERRKQRL